MKNSKYYIPSIDEFHIGFQYEEDIRDIGSDGDYDIDWGENWINNEFTSGEDLDNIRELIELERVRVKYLDKSDIESCGFKIDTSEIYEEKYYMSYRANDSIVYNLIFDPKNKEFPIQITSTFLSRFGDYLFKGTIKNINELHKLLKQLGIE